MSSGPVETDESVQDAVAEVERLRAGLHDLIGEWAQGWRNVEEFDQRDAYRALQVLLGPAFDADRCQVPVPPAPVFVGSGDAIAAAREESVGVRRFDGEALEGNEQFLRIVARSEKTTLVASVREDDETEAVMVFICSLADDEGVVHYGVSDGESDYVVTTRPLVAWETALKFADQGFEWDVAADTRLRARSYRDTPVEFLP